ncbi:hypothetical protein PoB_006708500 [Plakobranchus ocellatus]|uniref:Uncharacterized protein n=1 Tax=Plakobranchus ocellatus TaxID=259542 RepID=A0AAV4D937_9GAST|nr:hypothetical protein PoB_006708500 [Plakobranchus ocellatus]
MHSFSGIKGSTSPKQKMGFGGPVDDEPALRSARIHLSKVRAPPPAPWPGGGSESLRSTRRQLLITTNETKLQIRSDNKRYVTASLVWC